MMRHSSIMVSRTLYQIGVVTLIAAIMWVGVGVYIASTKTTLTEVDPSILQPVNPSLDQDVIKALSERIKIEVDLTAFPTSSESATVNIIETPTVETPTTETSSVETSTTSIPAEVATRSATIIEEGI